MRQMLVKVDLRVVSCAEMPESNSRYDVDLVLKNMQQFHFFFVTIKVSLFKLNKLDSNLTSKFIYMLTAFLFYGSRSIPITLLSTLRTSELFIAHLPYSLVDSTLS